MEQSYNAMNQDQLPLWDALQAYRAKDPVRMHMPGHKGGLGFPEPLASSWGELAEFDVTEIEEGDDLYAPQGSLRLSQQLLAALYGAKESFFLVNGASVGLMAALLAVLPGNAQQRKVMLPKQAHRSLWHGSILADIWPVSAEVTVDPETALVMPPSVAAIDDLLRRHPDIRAAVLLHPSYHGLTGDLKEQIRLLHSRGIPVIVDEAHGTHLRFLPREFAAIPDALQCGADVVIQSPHKTAGSLTQSAWMHCQGELVAADQVQAALRLLHSSSPSFPLLLSLEAARRQLAQDGRRLWAEACERIQRLQRQIAGGGKLSILQQRLLPVEVRGLDPSKLYLLTRECGFSGYQAAELLREWGVSAEMADIGGVLWMHSHGDNDRVYAALSEALRRLEANARPALAPLNARYAPPYLERVCSPRQAWTATRREIHLGAAVNCIAAEMITPYPPGIPLVTPGEIVTPEVVELITDLIFQGARVTGVAPETQSIKVVLEN